MSAKKMEILQIPCNKGTLPWQPFLSFYMCGVHWRHLANTTESSVCVGDSALGPMSSYSDHLFFVTIVLSFRPTVVITITGTI